MPYAVVNTVPSRAQPAQQSVGDLLLWRYWQAARAPLPVGKNTLTHVELNWAVFRAAEEQQNHVH